MMIKEGCVVAAAVVALTCGSPAAEVINEKEKNKQEAMLPQDAHEHAPKEQKTANRGSVIGIATFTTSSTTASAQIYNFLTK